MTLPTGSATATGAAGLTSETDVGTPWQRLDPRMLVLGPISGLVRLLPFVAVLLVTGQGDPKRLWFAIGAGGLVVAVAVVRWSTTRYRITPDRLELHSGWIRRQRRSVPRDRIRTVDLTARLEHRVFGLSVVRISSAAGSAQDSAELRLDAVSRAEADRLRRELLAHTPAAARAPLPAPQPAEELARLRWSWLRFAPLTFSALAGVGAIGAAVFNLLNEFGVDPRDIGAVDDAAARLGRAPIWLGIALVGVALLAVAVVGAVLLFAERWYDYRLSREPDGTLRVERGLFTRRSLSVSQRRLRGVEIVEPLLLRAGRGAQCRALSTGLSKESRRGELQPPAPRAEAHRVASAALREHPAEITGAALLRHPVAARTRRLTRALVPAGALVLAAYAFGPAWLDDAALGLLPLAALLGLDRYRGLGHALTARHLVIRRGGLIRRTAALQRDGVIGWTFRQSVFQRRSGLVTVEATTAAGSGGYTVQDVRAADGVALADATVPHLLTPFLAPPGGR